MARIVFDLDGTLIDSAPDIQHVANTVLAREGVEPISLARTRAFIGNGVGVFVQKMCAARGLPDNAQGRLVTQFEALYQDATGLTKPYPNVETALAALTGAGHVLGICTNKPIKPTQAVLSHLSLGGYFSTVYGGDSLPVRKPDPAPLRAALGELGEGRSIYVGDSDVDAETAQRANIPFLLFTEGYRKVPVAQLPHAGAFDDFAQLTRLVERILSRTA